MQDNQRDRRQLPSDYETCFLVAQTTKNLLAKQETQVQSSGREDPLKKGMAGYPLQYSCLENSTDGGAWGGYSPWCLKELDTTEQLTLSL